MSFHPWPLIESIPYQFFSKLKQLKLATYCLSKLFCDKVVKGLVTLGLQTFSGYIIKGQDLFCSGQILN